MLIDIDVLAVSKTCFKSLGHNGRCGKTPDQLQSGLGTPVEAALVDNDLRNQISISPRDHRSLVFDTRQNVAAI